MPDRAATGVSIVNRDHVHTPTSSTALEENRSAIYPAAHYSAFCQTASIVMYVS